MQVYAAELVSLSMNGRAPAAPEASLEFEPGKSHALRVAPDWAGLKGDRVAVVVRRTQPDGQVETLKAEARRGGACDFDLGPLTAPPVYDFRCGAVLRRGYRLQVSLEEPGTGRSLWSTSLAQGQCAKPAYRLAGQPVPAGVECLVPGDAAWERFLPHRAVGEAVTLRLSDKVLRDPDSLIVQAALTQGACVSELPCELRISGPDGRAVHTAEVRLGPPGETLSHRVAPNAWPPGDYAVRLCPKIGDKTWSEGPAVTYRRRPADPEAVTVSTLAPWKLGQDPARKAWETRDFRKACMEFAAGVSEGWQLEGSGDQAALICPPGVRAAPVELRLPLKGYYALFATPAADGCLIQAGDKELARLIRPGEARGEVFVCAADLTGSPVRVLAFDPINNPRSGLAGLRLVPVTGGSVKAFRQEAGHPPVPLTGVDDWAEYFHGPVRAEEDQLEAVVGGQAELGLRALAWSVGRSWVEYHSRLPQTTRFPCIPLEEAAKVFDKAANYLGRTTMLERYDPLATALALRERHGVRVWGWLSMNRHYGSAYGGMFASRWFREHPQWHDWGKNATKPLGSVVCYYFPEVRRERVEILKEVAGRSPDGLVVGCCRQVPMLLYHPEMVAAFHKETGIDPLKIDAANRDEYEKWIRWRANHFTEVLRMLRRELAAEGGKKVPVAARVPSVGLFLNLAQGLDIEQWLREGLVDCLQLDPLETCAGEGVHDVRPYIELARRHKVRVIGGVGTTWANGGPAHVAGLRRALGLLEAGVDGIEIYETECQARASHFRWILPLFGNAPRLKAFLAESNLEACFPVNASSAFYGHDNHSKWGPGGWTMQGSSGAVL